MVIVVRISLRRTGEYHGAEGIHEHQRRFVLFHFGADALQHHVQITLEHFLRQVDQMDRTVDRRVIEEIELLLVAQHLQRRLAQHRQIQSRALRCRHREHHLMSERGLAAAGRPRNEVERELRQAAAQHFVQARHAGRQAIDFHFGDHV